MSTSSQKQVNLIQIGKIVATFGIRGEVKIYPMTNYKEMFLDFDTVLAKGKEGHTRLTVLKSRIQKNTVIASIREIPTIEAAEGYIGTDLYVEEAQLPELEDDEQYLYQILDMQVYDTKGDYLGVIADVFENGAHSVYVVRDGDKEILLPGIPGVILEKDLEVKRMLVEIPPGLLD